MYKSSIALLGAALMLASCSTPTSSSATTPVPGTSSALVDLDNPEHVSFRVTTTSRELTKFDRENDIERPATVQEDSKMTFTYDGAGEVDQLRIDPIQAGGTPSNEAFLLDVQAGSARILDKKTGRTRGAPESTAGVLKAMKTEVASNGNPLVPPTLSTIRAQGGEEGFRTLSSAPHLVVLSRTESTSQGRVTTKLTFDRASEQLQQIHTRTENAETVNTNVQNIAYQEYGGRQIVDEVEATTTIELKDKNTFGTIDMPEARVLKPGEQLELKPGEYVAAEFSSPLRPGPNDTSVYTYHSVTEYTDIVVR